MAGLSAALMLGRAGHDIVLLDRDSVFRKCNWEESLLDKREGIAHFFQPHVFWPRGRTLFKRARRMFTNRFLKPALSSYACIAISRTKLSRPTRN
jgi:2-polyprenyl-6-methoxyphenol hydroxylase-like FAD-dependent oxidoreductase